MLQSYKILHWEKLQGVTISIKHTKQAANSHKNKLQAILKKTVANENSATTTP